MSGTPIGFGVGAGPQCLVEDPSDQFFYTANFYFFNRDRSGDRRKTPATLTPLSQASKVPASYALTGQPTWCLVDGRTKARPSLD